MSNTKTILRQQKAVTRRHGLLEITYEPIPDRMLLTAKEWREWCDDRDFYCLGNHAGSRGAWIDELKTYIRAGAYLIYRDGRLVDITDDQVPWSKQLSPDEIGEER